MDNTTLAVSVPEAARRLGLSRATLFELLRRGELPRRRVGCRTLIAVVDLQAFLDAALVETVSPGAAQ